MKPAEFQYFRPNTLDEAIGLLSEYADDAKILAGGQSLVPAMNMRLARPRYIVDINKIPELNFIRLEGEQLVIGALTRHVEVEESALISETLPLLQEAIAQVGHPQIRSRGTFGGSLVHADPAAELPAVAAALEATFHIRGPEGDRVLGADSFFLTYMSTAINETEILYEVRLPLPPRGTGWSFLEYSRRSGDFALVGVAAIVGTGEEEEFDYVRIALTGVADKPVRAFPVEERLLGRKATPETIAAASESLREMLEPEPDIHGTAEYRRDLAVTLTRRALLQAVSRKG